MRKCLSLVICTMLAAPSSYGFVATTTDGMQTYGQNAYEQVIEAYRRLSAEEQALDQLYSDMGNTALVGGGAIAISLGVAAILYNWGTIQSKSKEAATSAGGRLKKLVRFGRAGVTVAELEEASVAAKAAAAAAETAFSVADAAHVAARAELTALEAEGATVTEKVLKEARGKVQSAKQALDSATAELDAANVKSVEAGAALDGKMKAEAEAKAKAEGEKVASGEDTTATPPSGDDAAAKPAEPKQNIFARAKDRVKGFGKSMGEKQPFKAVGNAAAAVKKGAQDGLAWTGQKTGLTTAKNYVKGKLPNMPSGGAIVRGTAFPVVPSVIFVGTAYEINDIRNEILVAKARIQEEREKLNILAADVGLVSAY